MYFFSTLDNIYFLNYFFFQIVKIATLATLAVLNVDLPPFFYVSLSTFIYISYIEKIMRSSNKKSPTYDGQFFSLFGNLREVVNINKALFIASNILSGFFSISDKISSEKVGKKFFNLVFNFISVSHI